MIYCTAYWRSFVEYFRSKVKKNSVLGEDLHQSEDSGSNIFCKQLSKHLVVLKKDHQKTTLSSYPFGNQLDEIQLSVQTDLGTRQGQEIYVLHGRVKKEISWFKFFFFWLIWMNKLRTWKWNVIWAKVKSAEQQTTKKDLNRFMEMASSDSQEIKV